MDKSKKFLNISIGISIIICSFCLLIFSTRQNKAFGQTNTVLPNGVVVAGAVFLGSGFSGNYYVLGYNPKDGAVSVLGKISAKDLRD